MKKLLIGILIGILGTVAVTVKIMPAMMLSEMQSPLGYEETIAYIENNVTNAGWKVSAVMRLDKTLAKEGKTVRPVASMKICQPDHAEKVLLDDDARFLSVMMPCTIAVYEKTDGRTYIATMNAALMGRMFGGTAAEVMGGPVAEETAAFIAFE
jgi:uncharacterized protein (DUF302 family)